MPWERSEMTATVNAALFLCHRALPTTHWHIDTISSNSYRQRALKHWSGGSSGLRCGGREGVWKRGSMAGGLRMCFSFSMFSRSGQSFVLLSAVKCWHACLSIGIIRVDVWITGLRVRQRRGGRRERPGRCDVFWCRKWNWAGLFLLNKIQK